MPTCSQAKIITNLESDIHKRLFELANLNLNSLNNQCVSSSSSNSSSSGAIISNNNLGDESPHYFQSQQVNSNMSKCKNKNGTVLKKASLKLDQDFHNNTCDQPFYYPQSNLLDIRKKTIYELVKPSQLQNSTFISKSRRQSINFNEQKKQSDQLLSNCCKMPPIFQNEKPILFNTNDRRDSVPINFLYNSPLRNNLKQERIIKAHLKFKNNGDEIDDQMIANSSDLNSENSNISLPDIVGDNEKFKKNEKVKNSKNDFTHYVQNHDKSKRNSFDSDISNGDSSYKSKFNSLSNHNLSSYFANFPKLALEVEAIEQYSNSLATIDQNSNNVKINNDIDYSDQRKFSVNQAKRLLALASIRPSKTFHKTMTDEEVVLLKKYYEEIKPKSLCNNHSSNNINAGMSQEELEKMKYESYPPIVYDTSKVDFSSLKKLRQFIETHKKDLEQGNLRIDFDLEPKGFFLKDAKSHEKLIKLPDELNDSFLALASASSPDKESQLMNEANLFKIVNWNDTAISSFDQKSNLISRKKLSKKSKINREEISNIHQNDLLPCSTSFTNSCNNLNSVSSPISHLSFDYIKNLSNLVNSIIEPKLLKQIAFTGVDVSVLPGGKNFEMPSFEEMGIDLNSILENHDINNNGDQIMNSNKNSLSNKVKLSTIKKLKEKVTSSKVMWFSSPPERKPLSVIFEVLNSNKIDHETILNQTNDYLKEIGGFVESLELIPRSVQFGSVYVEDLWVLNLNGMNTKFFTITNGIKINNQKVMVKSYDDFIFSEYERFIRNEKYKKIIKNHEKSLAIKSANNKINYNSNEKQLQ